MSGLSEISGEVNKLKQTLSTLGTNAKGGIIDNDALRQAKVNCAELEASFKKVGSVSSKSISSGGIKQFGRDAAASVKDIDLFNARVDRVISANSKMNKATKAQFEGLKIDPTNTSLSLGDISDKNKQLRTINATMKATGQAGRSMMDELGNDFGKFSQWIGASTVFMQGVNFVTNGFSSLKEIDDGMIELKKVTEATSDEFNNFYDSANGIAKQLGVSTAEVVKQTAAWAQLGYSLKDATTLAKDSAIFKTISPDMTIDQSTNTLVSTMKAYGIEAGDVLDGIASKINIVGNNFAANNGDIATILQKSSAAMAAAGNTLDQNIALGTAGQEIVQDADVVGNH